MAFVAIKMGRRSGSCRTRGGRISDRCVTDPAAAGQPAGPFSSQPFGPWPVGCFSSAAADHSLRINSDMLVASASAARTALKNSQPIRQLPDESHVIWDRTLATGSPIEAPIAEIPAIGGRRYLRVDRINDAAIATRGE